MEILVTIEKELIFEIPECPNNNEVKINKNFRLLCICNYNSISKMSPAFLNRFDIITLEDQLKPSYFKNPKNDIIELIDTLMKQHSYNYHSNLRQNEKDQKLNEKIIKYSKFLKIKGTKINTEEKKNDYKYIKDEILNNLIFNKISNEIMKGDLSMYKLSLFCRAVYIFTQELDPNKELNRKQLVNYAYSLIISSKIEDDQNIEDFICQKFLNYEPETSNDNKFFFKKSPKLRSFIAKLLASSMINLHICVVGPTGIRKTSCTREFSRIRKNPWI